MSVKYKPSRRDFLKLSGATLITTQVPGSVEATPKTIETTPEVVPLTDNKYHGVMLDYLPVRRYVAFAIYGYAGRRLLREFPIPEVGNVVGSPDLSKLFIVASPIPVACVTDFKPHVPVVLPGHEKTWVPSNPLPPDSRPPCSAVVMKVEAIARGLDYATCPITRFVDAKEIFDFVIDIPEEA